MLDLAFCYCMLHIENYFFKKVSCQYIVYLCHTRNSFISCPVFISLYIYKFIHTATHIIESGLYPLKVRLGYAEYDINQIKFYILADPPLSRLVQGHNQYVGQSEHWNYLSITRNYWKIYIRCIDVVIWYNFLWFLWKYSILRHV